MTHIISYIKAFVTVIVIAVCTNHIVYFVSKIYVSDSEFRLVQAGSADEKYSDKKGIVLFSGNSRLMAGISSNTFSNANGLPAYNIAYNGMTHKDVQDYVGSFIETCNCDVSTIVINMDIFRERASNEGSEFKIFLAAFNNRVFNEITENDLFEKIKLTLFPLLLFNNEFFSRAVYYKSLSLNDQLYSNNYNIKVNNAIISRLKTRKIDQAIDIANLESIIKYFSRYNIDIIFLIAPYHPSYIDNVTGFKEHRNSIKIILSDLGAKYYDHSELYYNANDLFSDPIHLDRQGQMKYTKYLSGILGGK